MDMLMNPKSQHVKKVMFEILKERYGKNENIIERLSAALVTDNDMKDFFNLVTNIYEAAYFKCVEDHKEQLKKAGLAVNVVPESTVK